MKMSSSSDSSENEIRVGSKVENNVSNPLNQFSKSTKIKSNSILQRGIPSNNIQNILYKKVNSMKKSPGYRKYVTIYSSESEDSSGIEKNRKSNRRRGPIPETISQTKMEPLVAKKCESGSESDNEIKFPNPKVIKREEDLESYRPGVISTDTEEVRFPQPVNIKQEPGFEVNIPSQNNSSVSTKGKLKRKDSNCAEIANDTKKEKAQQCSSESNSDAGASIRRKLSNSKMKTAKGFTSSDLIQQEVNFDEQPSDSDDDDKLVEKIEAAVEKKISRINVLQNVTLNKPRTPQDQLAELLPNLEHLKTKLDMDLSETDLYLAMIPSSIDPYVLLNQESIHEDCKIKVGKKYNLKCTEKKLEPCILISDCNKLIKFKGNIVVSHYIKKQKMPSFDVEQKQPVCLPHNLKNRHPLFGSIFDNIQLSDEIQQKLAKAKDKVKSKLSSSLKKSKKKKENKSHTLQEPEAEEIIYNLLNNSKSFTLQSFEGKSQDKKSNNVGQGISSKSVKDRETRLPKKRKRSYQMDNLQEMAPIENSICQDPQKQRVDIKKELFSEHAEPSINKKKQKGAEKNTVNTSYLDNPLKGDIKQASFTKCETDSEFLTKKKRKSGGKNNTVNTNVDCEVDETYNKKKKVDIKNELFTEYENDAVPTNKKNKENSAKKNNFRNTNYFGSQQDESDDNYEVQVLKLKKRKVDAKKELCPEYESDSEIPRKKKNKEDITKGMKDIKMEIFTEYETEAETNSLKKKKKSKRSETAVDYSFEADEYGRDIESTIYTKNILKKVKSELLIEYQTNGENDTKMDTYREGYTDRELNKVKKKKNKFPKFDNLKKEILTDNESVAETAGQSIKKELVTDFEADLDSLYTLEKKMRNKNKKGRKSLANSTLRTDFSIRPSFSPDLSCIPDELSDNFKYHHVDIDVMDNSLIDSVNSGFKHKIKMNKERK